MSVIQRWSFPNDMEQCLQTGTTHLGKVLTFKYFKTEETPKLNVSRHE